MNGNATYEFATQKAFTEILKMLDLKELPSDTYLISHQASIRILNSICDFNNLNKNQVYFDGVKTGNNTGASVFMGLEDTLNRNLAKDYSQIMLGAFGAELQTSAAILKEKN